MEKELLVDNGLLLKNQRLVFNKFNLSNDMHGVSAMVSSSKEDNTNLDLKSVILYYPRVSKDNLLFSFTNNALEIFRKNERVFPIFFIAYNEQDSLGTSNYSIFIRFNGRYCRKHDVLDFDLHGIHPYFLKAPAPKYAVKFVTRNVPSDNVLLNTKLVYCSNQTLLLTEYLERYLKV